MWLCVGPTSEARSSSIVRPRPSPRPRSIKEQRTKNEDPHPPGGDEVLGSRARARARARYRCRPQIEKQKPKTPATRPDARSKMQDPGQGGREQGAGSREQGAAPTRLPVIPLWCYVPPAILALIERASAAGTAAPQRRHRPVGVFLVPCSLFLVPTNPQNIQPNSSLMTSKRGVPSVSPISIHWLV